MTGARYFRAVNTRRNRWLAAGTILIVAGIWLLVPSDFRGNRNRSDRENSAMSSTPTETKGMAGMPGMAEMPASRNGEITFSADQKARFGITFGVVALRPLVLETRTTGVVTFDETRIAQVAPKVSGVIETLFVDFTGQPVRRGQPLLQIYSPELIAAQEELLLSATLQRSIGGTPVPGIPAGSSNLVEAAKQRLRLADISESEIDAIQRSGRVRRALTLYSPTSGVVIEKKVVRGQAITVGQQLYTIADLSRVWVEVQLREADAAAVHIGSDTYLDFAAMPGRQVTGRVTYVYPTLDSGARAIRARVIVANASGAIKPGMYATVRIATPTRSALTVPASAVLRTGERNLVFIQLANGNLAPREVRTGISAGGYTEILSGVSSAQRVVTSAQFLLDSESNLSEIMRAMVGQGR